ncbi:MAG: hypothetical protein NPIRA03_28810 [Nitrospirales bacterium]|nr:MAG: hypothetical protein NPIRA03_28810 [Nitrospirales bacterium]
MLGKRCAAVRLLFSRPQTADGVLTKLKGLWLLDVGWREIDAWPAEQSPRLAALPSRLRQSNARVESTGLRPATQL